MEQDTLNNNQEDHDTIDYRLDELEKQCHFFHMQVEKMVHLYGLVQQHELKIYDLEKIVIKDNNVR
jgi:hypothetical protein